MEGKVGDGNTQAKTKAYAITIDALVNWNLT